METLAIPRITIEPDKCGGRPCIRGMRIRVSDILGLLAAGASHAEILADFPAVLDEDVSAALEYAARVVNQNMPSTGRTVQRMQIQR